MPSPKDAGSVGAIPSGRWQGAEIERAIRNGPNVKTEDPDRTFLYRRYDVNIIMAPQMIGGMASLGTDWLSIYYDLKHKQEPLYGYGSYSRRYKGNWSVMGVRS